MLGPDAKGGQGSRGFTITAIAAMLFNVHFYKYLTTLHPVTLVTHVSALNRTQYAAA
jgi:hypothetical protein